MPWNLPPIIPFVPVMEVPWPLAILLGLFVVCALFFGILEAKQQARDRQRKE